MKRTPNEFRSKSGEAFRFHELAWPFLSELGFELVNDPSLIRSPYQTTWATYKSKRGLFLCVGFDPIDGNNALITCGRQWLGDGRWLCLSNHYSVLTKRLGLELPTLYELGYREEARRTMERILEDLKRTLPIVMERATLADLVSIESEEFGAERIAAIYLGPNYSEHVEISEY